MQSWDRPFEQHDMVEFIRYIPGSLTPSIMMKRAKMFKQRGGTLGKVTA